MNKYFDYENQRFLDEEKDGISVDKWMTDDIENGHKFGTDGLCKIFVRGGQAKDEYELGDPYTVDLNNEFHKRRVDLTVALIKEIKILENNRKLKVLDIGCGKGYITNEIIKNCSDIDMTACDYSYSAIKYACKQFSDRNICFDVADINDLPYSPGYFDVVILNNVFEHIPNIIGCIQSRIKEILSDRGYVIISTPSRYRIENIASVLRGKGIQLISENHVTEYSVGQVIECMGFCGYESINILSKSLKAKNIKSHILMIIKAILKCFTKRIINTSTWESTVFYLFQKKC